MKDNGILTYSAIYTAYKMKFTWVIVFLPFALIKLSNCTWRIFEKDTWFEIDENSFIGRLSSMFVALENYLAALSFYM